MGKLNKTEDLDFHYLLTLMQPLHDVREFSWLPELFSIIGHENLIRLCKYAGGEKIAIPTLYQLSDSLDSLQNYYDVFIKRCKSPSEIPDKLNELVYKIKEVYDSAQQS